MDTILIKPIITEKSMKEAKNGVFSFSVGNHASKGAIADAIHEQFGVDVLKVRTLKTFSKIKRGLSKSRKTYISPAVKKALIIIKKGQKISLFELEDKKKSKSKKV